MSNRAFAMAQSRYDNMHEEDCNPESPTDKFIESTYGCNWMHDEATDLVAGRDSTFVTQDQFRQHITERLSDLEWDDDQDDAHVDLIIYAYTDQRGGKPLVERLFGAGGLMDLANDLLLIADAPGQYLEKNRQH